MALKILILMGMIFFFTILEIFIPKRKFNTNHDDLNHDFVNLLLLAINITLIFGATYYANRLMFNSKLFTEYGLFQILKLPDIVELVCVFIVFDAWMYIYHRLNHEVYFLWRFHRVHHTDKNMNFTTVQRYHTVETIYTIIAKTAVVFLLGISPIQYLIYELSLNFIAMFHHSNINLNEKLDHILKYVIVTPNMHRTHHVINYHDSNSNYSSIFSVWDRIFKSFCFKEESKIKEFGQDRFRDKKWSKLFYILLITPFIKKKVIKKGNKFVLFKKETV